MATPHTCARCGTVVSGYGPAGLCPKCLLLAGLDVDVESPTTPETGSHPHLRRFADYELIEEVAHGGMGVVYRARQISLNRIVALKLLLFGRFSTPEFVHRFRAEATAAASLQHPNIVAIHEVGEHDGQHYFSMDYVEGRSLAESVRARPLPARQAARYLEKIAEAIHYAHEKGILHRDLKPSNILLDEFDQPRITDFGLAKQLGSSAADAAPSELTQSGQVLGSPSYMPPEQAVGKRGALSPASDVYSLGAILFHLLTGRPPFVAESIAETLAQVCHTEPVSPRVLNPAVPRDLETICLKCLEKESSRRCSTARELAEELGRFLRDEPIHARPASVTTKATRWCRRNPLVAALACSLLLALSAGLVISISQWRRAERNAATVRQGLVRLSIANGSRLAEEGNPLGALVWFAEGFRQDSDRSREAEDVHRRRLGWILRRAPKLVQLWAHHEPVNRANFTPDGRHVSIMAGGATDAESSIRSVHLVDVVSGQSVARFVATNDTGVVHLTPDGRWLATGHGPGTVRIWDVRKGTVRTEMRAHAARILNVRFSPDGKSVLSGAVDGTAQIFDASSGEPLAPAWQHDGTVAFSEFSPDGRRVVTASATGKLRVWDASDGAPVTDWITLGASPNRVLFSPDSRRIFAGAGNRGARIFDAATGRTLVSGITLDSYRPAVAFSGDGTRVAVATRDSFVRLWNTTNGTLAAPPLRHHHVVFSLAFSPDGRWLATGAGDWQARIWDATSGELIAPPLCHGGLVKHVAFNADGHCLATASDDGTARIWDLAISPLFTPMAAAATNQVVGRATSLDFANGDTALATALTRVEQFQRAMERPVNGDPNNVRRSTLAVLSPDGKRVATASLDSTARVWDSKTGQPITPVLKHEHGVRGLMFSPDGRFLLTRTANQHLRIWHAGTGEAITSLLRDSEIQEAGFTKDSQQLVCFLGARKKPYLVSLAADERPLSDLHHLAELLGGHRLDAIGGVTPLPASASMERWMTLKSRYPSEFTTAPEQVRAWHHMQLDQSMAIQQWDAARFHAERLLVGRPDDLQVRQSLRVAQNELVRPGRLMADTNLARLIPARDKSARPELIDLTPFYNGLLSEDVHPSSSGGPTGNNLAELPLGVQKLGGVDFDVRAIIKLYGGVYAQRGVTYPKELRGIPIARHVQKVHFLHGTGYGVNDGDQIGAFVIHIGDGSEEEVPLVYGRSVLNWWTRPDPSALASDSAVAWTGSNERIRMQRGTLHLYRTTWTNPKPNTEISTIDFLSSLTATGPFLIAITVE